jgi:hypothetical protein
LNEKKNEQKRKSVMQKMNEGKFLIQKREYFELSCIIAHYLHAKKSPLIGTPPLEKNNFSFKSNFQIFGPPSKVFWGLEFQTCSAQQCVFFLSGTSTEFGLPISQIQYLGQGKNIFKQNSRHTHNTKCNLSNNQRIPLDTRNVPQITSTDHAYF